MVAVGGMYVGVGVYGYRGWGFRLGWGVWGGSCMWGYGVLNWCRVVVGVSDMGIGGFERGLIKNTQLSRIK